MPPGYLAYNFIDLDSMDNTTAMVFSYQEIIISKNSVTANLKNANWKHFKIFLML